MSCQSQEGRQALALGPDPLRYYHGVFESMPCLLAPVRISSINLLRAKKLRYLEEPPTALWVLEQ